MKFTAATLLSIAGLATAAPAPVANGQGGGGPAVSFSPGVVSQYSVWSGAIKYNTGVGKVFKNGQTTDISTLLTFTYPAASAGKTCSINLYLDSASTQTGAKEIDIFSSLAPAPGPRSSWGPGNQRNNHLGRIKITKPGSGVYESGYPKTGASYPCPAPGTKAGYEFVATDDTTNTVWTQAAGVGAYISYV
jgi:hypothetical protein